MFHWEWKTVTYIALDYFSFTICSVAMMSKMAFFCSRRKILVAVGTWNIVDMHIHLQRWTWLDLYSPKIPPVIILWQYNMSLSEKNNFYWKKNPVNFEKIDRDGKGECLITYTLVVMMSSDTMFVQKLIHDGIETSLLNYDHNEVL